MHVVSSNFALVIVDSSSDQHTFVKEVMLPVLMFWGLPFETIDLGQTASHSPSAPTPSVIVVIQEGIPAERFAGLAPIFEASVAAGAGIVNCDPGLEINASTGGGKFAFANRAWSDARPVRHVSVTPGDHFITRMQRAYTEFALRKPLASLPGPEGSDATVLLADEAGGPLLTLESGPVPVVRWRLSSWVWSQDFLGFARGMDALLWRSILWAARKPFGIAALPPFGRFRFDDCRGLWKTPDDLRFLDVMNEFGEVPNLGICLSALTTEGWAFLAERAKQGKVEVSPHVLEPEIGIFNTGEEQGLSANADPLVERIKGLFGAHACPMAGSVSDHNHELTQRGIHIARALGLNSRMNVMRVGERWETLHKRWRPAPFGTMHYALDRFVDAPELFTAINHHASFSDSFLALQEDRFLCTTFGGFTEDRWDFLNGYVGPSEKNLDFALERLLRHTELALTSLFFAGSITHTHFARHLIDNDWRSLLTGYRAYADKFAYQPRAYDEIVAYASNRLAPKRVRIDLEGTEGGVWVLAAHAGPGGSPTEKWVRSGDALEVQRA
jgi:hypothetical protein